MEYGIIFDNGEEYRENRYQTKAAALSEGRLILNMLKTGDVTCPQVDVMDFTEDPWGEIVTVLQ